MPRQSQSRVHLLCSPLCGRVRKTKRKNSMTDEPGLPVDPLGFAQALIDRPGQKHHLLIEERDDLDASLAPIMRSLMDHDRDFTLIFSDMNQNVVMTMMGPNRDTSTEAFTTFSAAKHLNQQDALLMVLGPLQRNQKVRFAMEEAALHGATVATFGPREAIPRPSELN